MATGEAVQVLDPEINLEEFGAEYAEKALVLRQSVAIEKIENEGQFQQICTAGLEAAANIKALEAYIEPIKNRAYARWKRITSVLSEKTAPFVAVKEKSSKLVGKYQYEIQQKRAAEEEAERKKLADEEEKLRAKQAEQLAREDRIEDGIALLDSPMFPAPAMASTPAPKAQGVSAAAEKWSAFVNDLPALVKAVAEGRVPILAILPNQSFLDQQARSLKQLLRYDGVEVKREFRSSFRPK